MVGQHRANGGPSWGDAFDTPAGGPLVPAGLPVVSPVWSELEATQPRVPDLYDGHPSAPGPVSGEEVRRRVYERMDDVDLPRGRPWRTPSPRPRPSWSFYDFACWANFLHPDTGVRGQCGCRVPNCTIRAHLDLIDWGLNGPPLAPARAGIADRLSEGRSRRA